MLVSKRFTPSLSRRELVRRSRLLRRLQLRWDHRAVIVVGGAGFGKTTLLAQGMEENRLAPRGDDCWLTCSPHDADAMTFAEGLATALGIDVPGQVGSVSTPASLAELLSNVVWRQAPRHVCLILDDVHELPAGTKAAVLLSELLTTLPANGHLVMASRHRPPLRLAGWEAQGQLIQIDESDLALSDAELASFALMRGVSLERLNGIGGWPALAELRTWRHHRRVDDFLDEEVLEGLTVNQRRAMAIVATIGGADDALLAQLVGHEVDLAGLLHELPLTSSDEDGWHTVHPLWRGHFANRLEPAERTRVRREAGWWLLSRDFRTAMDLLIAADDSAAIEAALCKSCRAPDVPTSTLVLDRLCRELPPAVQERPIGRVVTGVAAAKQDIELGIAHLEAARHAFRSEGDESGAMLAIEHLALYHYWREDIEALQALLPEFEALLHGRGARGVRGIARAFVAEAAGDARATLAALDEIDEARLDDSWVGPLAWFRGNALLALGYPDVAQHSIELAVGRASLLLRGAMRIRLVIALSLANDRATAFSTLERMLEEVAEAGNTHTFMLGQTEAAIQHALAGRVEVAREYLHRARLHAGPEPEASMLTALLGAETVTAVADRDEDEAARLLCEQRQGRALGQGRQRYGELRRLPLQYVLESSTREYWRGLELGPCFELARDLAEAIVALRERADLTAAASLGSQHWMAAPSFIPPNWQAELVIAAVAASGEARRVPLELSPPLRHELRSASEDLGLPRPVRQWARTLLCSHPEPPSTSLEVNVLGPTSLNRKGKLVEHPHWRRQRVRFLLLLLIARGGGARDEIAGILWPDLDESAAARNLRVTLSYLLSVLEPERADGAPSWFIRSEAASLVLVRDEFLRVDAWEMERLLDLAGEAEQAGEPSLALDRLLYAVNLYRGPYLSDAGYEDWALPHRDRIAARFVTGAVRAGELTLTAGDTERALRLASRALAVEPYSEPAHRLIVTAHLAANNTAAAHRAMEACRRGLAELDMVPSEDFEIVERALRSRGA